MRTRLLALLSAAALAIGLTPAAVAAPADWHDLGLAHADRRQVHFRGAALPRPGSLAAIAVTADSAVVMSGMPNEPANRLVLLPGGTTIGRHVRGIPMAEVAGHRVFWTSKHGHGDFRLHAYDTSTGTSYEHPLGRVRWIVAAVDGDTAYGSRIESNRWSAWTPGTGFQRLELPADAILTDVSGGMVSLLAEDDAPSIVAPDGAVLASGVTGWLTFDPSGAYAAQLGEWGVGVWDVAHARSIKLVNLDGRRWFDPVWAANGELVVTTYTSRRDERHWDDANPVVHHRCPMAVDAVVAACTVVPTRQPHPTGLDPIFGVTALDQLIALDLFA
ncbi:hypothetical protein [Nocardioides sp. SR21]|uniref:hypothetical protein n=1 Tax=Nocardioides sp. SR21 TaxID=2919501 RepID=UPI001FA96F29|nr:hypothetical protein [Nocardioides sp. SR21]